MPGGMFDKAYEFHGPAFNAARTPELPLNSTHARQRVALCTSLAAILFLTSYLVLHALHVASLDPPGVARLSRVPLFANLCASGAFGLLGGFVLGSSVRGQESILRRLPLCFAWLSVVFALEALLLP